MIGGGFKSRRSHAFFCSRFALFCGDYVTINEKEFFSEVIAAENLDKEDIPDYIKSGIREVLK